MGNAKGNLVIAQGGGPTPVINASLYGVVQEALARLSDDSEIWGGRHGIEGVLAGRFIDLRRQPEGRWEQVRAAPGAACGSCRKKLNDDDVAQAFDVLKKHDVRYFFYNGGNDSMDTCNKMSKAAAADGYELFVGGVPKTIDNDLPETDHCPGFGSAARYIAQSVIDLGADIRSLPTPVSVIETMGRNAGWLTASTVLARAEEDDAPHRIYLPEVPLTKERFLADVKAVYDELGWVVVAVSEGVTDENGESLGAAKGEAAVDGFGHKLPGDVATSLAHLVTTELGLRARSEKPGLCGRASALLASETDRDEAEMVGRHAVERAVSGDTDFMVALERAPGDSYSVSCRTVPLDTVANVERLVPMDYLNEDRNDVRADAFGAYAGPLVGGPLHRHARLEM